MGDIIYYSEASRHIGYEIFDMFNDASSLFMTALSQYSFLTLSTLIFALFYSFGVIKRLALMEIDGLSWYSLIEKMFIIVISIFFIRGMFQHIPLNPWQSNQVGESRLAPLALNVSYNVIYTLANSHDKLTPQKLPKMAEHEIEKSFQTLYDEPLNSHKLPKLNQPNIVLFFLESWSGVNIQSYGYSKTTTPFFDKLLESSVHSKAMIASGHRTTEGIFATLTSMQNPLGRSVAKSNLQGFSYDSIVEMLKAKKGYSSAFFQGSSKETSGTGSLAQNLGFTQSYGKRDIEDRRYEENYWGVYDQDLYAFTLQKLKRMKSPFIIGINGATTHDDKLPKGIPSLKLSTDKRLNRSLNALHFADRALGEFIQKMQEEYPNTLFVLFADHCGGVKGGDFENYLIPFALYHKDLKPKNYDVFLSQRDIAPTIYDLVIGDYKKDKINFSGKSLFSDKHFFADYYHNGILGWVEGHSILEINLVTQQKRCFRIEYFRHQQVACSEEVLSFEKHALNFTYISQKLLFSGKTKNFIGYRRGNE